MTRTKGSFPIALFSAEGNRERIVLLCGVLALMFLEALVVGVVILREW